MVKLMDRRIQGLHARARELIEDAEHERDHTRRKYLMDLASAHEHVADAFEVQLEKGTWPARSLNVTDVESSRRSRAPSA